MSALVSFIALAIGCGGGGMAAVDGGGAGTDAPARDAGPVMPGEGDYFPPGTMFFQEVVSCAPGSVESDAIIVSLRAAGGWGNGDLFQIDFSIEVLEADASAPRMDFTETGDFYNPDCDHMPIPMPVGGALEGESGYEC